MSMNSVFFLVDFICLLWFIEAIKGSSRRLASFGLAILGFILPAILGLVLTVIFGPKDAFGMAITLGSPIAAVWAAYRIPRRPESVKA